MSDGLPTDQLIGANVLRYRQARGLSQTQLADEIGVYQPTINKIETGTRPVRFVEAIAIARALGVGVDDLSAAPAQAGTAAAFAARFNALNVLTGELNSLAGRLASALVELADMTGVDRHAPDDYRATADVAERAKRWLTRDWPAELDQQLLENVRRHPYLADQPSARRASTYRDALTKLTKNVRDWRPSFDPPGKVDDDSEA